MFRPDLVISSLFTRVGWQQPTQGEYAVLTGDNLVSLSGRYFSDFHKAVTVKNIKETCEDPDISDTDFNTFLERLQKSAITRVLQGIFNQDVIIEQLQLFSRDYERQLRTIESEDKFVYQRIKVANDSSYAVRINSLSLLFDGVATFKMYCFHTAKGKIWEKEVTTVANQEVVVNITDLILSISEVTYKGGEFLIGYFQPDLGSVKAINYWSAQRKSSSIFGHCGGNAEITGAASYDSQTVVETNQDYGINIELTSIRDFTQVICRNASAFDEAVGLQVACDVVELIINSGRSNQTERIQKEQLQVLYTDLNQDMPVDGAPYSAGLKNRLKRELQRLNKNFFPKDQITTVQS